MRCIGRQWRGPRGRKGVKQAKSERLGYGEGGTGWGLEGVQAGTAGRGGRIKWCDPVRSRRYVISQDIASASGEQSWQREYANMEHGPVFGPFIMRTSLARPICCGHGSGIQCTWRFRR